jgi:predicted HTH domain antitoxin
LKDGVPWRKVSRFLDELDILAERGIYKNREELLQDAMRSLLRSKPELRIQVAIEIYKRGRGSLARGAEIGGVDIESFKEVLREAGIVRAIPPVREALRHEGEQFRWLRQAE